MTLTVIINIIFLLAVAGVIIMVTRRLPDAAKLKNFDDALENQSEEKLKKKGLPVKAAKKGLAWIKSHIQKLWKFTLEAKGLAQNPGTRYKINKFLKKAKKETKESQDENVSTNLKLSGSDVEEGSDKLNGVDNVKDKVDADDEQEAPKPKVGEADEAYYLDQIKKFPKKRENYNRLGLYYLENKQVPDALNIYEYLTKHEPSNADYWARLGYCYVSLDRNREAVKVYKKSIELDASHPNRFYNLALGLSQLKDYGTAAEMLEKAVELEPQKADYYDLLEEYYRKDGKLVKARAVTSRKKEMI